MTADQIKVAIADDHKIFRDGIKMALRDKEYLKILWEAEDGKDLMHKLKIKMPDVILMDIRMPEVDGINAISLIRKEYEGLKIIVLTMYDDQEMITKMMEMGANAYLTKTTDPEEIYQAILTCMNDDFYFCLLYTSDAADERSSVDLGGRRIIKKKKNLKLSSHDNNET